MRTRKRGGSCGIENFLWSLGQSAALAFFVLYFGAVESCIADSVPSFLVTPCQSGSSFFTTIVKKLMNTLTLAWQSQVRLPGLAEEKSIIFHLNQANQNFSALNCLCYGASRLLLLIYFFF